MLYRLFAAFLIILLAGVCTPALAHLIGPMSGGFSSGFEHPVLGADHLLAMLAVGIWGAQMGGRLVWSLPVAFPVMMAFGGLIGMSGFSISHVETAIGLSVLVLGLAIAIEAKPPEIVALGMIAFFAFFHGYAHGVELPAAADPAAYAFGFITATGCIHVVGIGIGLQAKKIAQGQIARVIGALIAAAGNFFLMS
jgi:urease accessory protein